LNKDTPRSLLWVSETFWSICVSVWEIGLHMIATGFDCSSFWLGKVWTLCRWMLRKWQLQARKGHRSSTGGTLAGLVGWLRRLLSHCSAEFLNELLSMQCGECYQRAGWASLVFCRSFILCTNGYVSAD
jgi:hypothetical protein